MVGLFESVIGLALVLGINALSRRLLGQACGNRAKPRRAPGRRPARKRKAGAWPPQTRGYQVFRVVNAIILTLVVLAVLLPFLNLLAQSFSSETYINPAQVSLWPRGFNVTTYEHVMSDPLFWENYRNTVLYTVCSTVVAMVLTTCYAYVLSRKQLRGRKVLIGIAVFTMFFNGGIIPNYILVSSLHLRDTVWAYRAAQRDRRLQPADHEDVLRKPADGARRGRGRRRAEHLPHPVAHRAAAVQGRPRDHRALLRGDVLELLVPALLYMDNQGLFPVTLYLENIVDSAHQRGQHRAVQRHPAADRGQHPGRHRGSRRRADPCVYPFVQRYFVSGVMLGAVKG